MTNPVVLLRVDGHPTQSACTCMSISRTALLVLSVVVGRSCCVCDCWFLVGV